MPRPYLIAPSILSADFTNLSKEITEAEVAGAGWIHIDVMDGHFVPNLTMGPMIVKTCRKITELPIDVHLMVSNPDVLLDDFIEAGANFLSVHIEACTHIHRTVSRIKQLGCHAGVAINPGTSMLLLEPVLDLVDFVLCMTVNPGYSGQTFIPKGLKRIASLSSDLNATNPNALIEVDGGISSETLPQVIAAGANVFVAASAVFNHPDGITSGLQALLELLPKETSRQPKNLP